MKKLLTLKQSSLAVSCALALGVLSGSALAQTSPADTAYLNDAQGGVPRSGFGLCWHTAFGPAANTPGCDPASVVVAAAEVPAPAPPAPPVMTPSPAGARVTLDADALFDFDKAVLRPAGRTALDEFHGKLKSINPEVIIAVGHADRFGSEAYNQTLSDQRAAAVRDYLIAKGVEPNRVHAEGKGEMQPMTMAGECAGAKSTKVIACLQPDRRVEIEVVGTQVVAN
jgi:OOP family OmpA-OmpF porin